MNVVVTDEKGYYQLREPAGFNLIFISVLDGYSADGGYWQRLQGNHENFGIERQLSLVSPTNPLYGRENVPVLFWSGLLFTFNYGSCHFIGLNSLSTRGSVLLWAYRFDAAGVAKAGYC